MLSHSKYDRNHARQNAMTGGIVNMVANNLNLAIHVLKTTIFLNSIL